MEGLELGDAITGRGEASGGSAGARTRKPSVEEPHPGAVEILLTLLGDSSNHGEIEMWAFAQDARDDGKVIPDELQDALDLPEGMDTYSWEDLFQMDLSEYEYVGYPPRNRSGESVQYEEGWDSSNFTGDLTGDTKRALNGHHAADIQDRLGPDGATANDPEVMVAIRVGRESDHNESFEEAHRFQRFYIQNTDMSGERVLKARRDVNDITDSEYEQLSDDGEE